MQKTNLKNHDLIITEDGSQSAFSKTYGENFHNTTGAASETLAHYVEGCKIVERAQEQEDFRILEVGLGLGVGVEKTYEAVKDLNCNIHFTTLEIDEELVLHLKETNTLFSDLEKQGDDYVGVVGSFHLRILLGDARERVKECMKNINAIYQDAFSPKRNATLWTTEWFKDLYELSADDCIMSTYSSSSSIRKSMLAAGWKIKKGIKFGKKRSSTRAYMTGESDSDIIEHLERSPAITLTDENAKDYHL
ncbi:MAG: hypothetical protein CME64_17545 [Halobacteriovoraceae bacterium]|nr:hypothetical protein [Halobacteriovoraceae bacterium]|tara:strand:- start:7584 stop:8330 length:747 start_codon:yes stop_codon:yes gene_type:complete